MPSEDTYRFNGAAIATQGEVIVSFEKGIVFEFNKRPIVVCEAGVVQFAKIAIEKVVLSRRLQPEAVLNWGQHCSQCRGIKVVR